MADVVACETCGQPARVAIVGEASGSSGSRHDYCLECADRPRSEPGMGRLAANLVPGFLISLGAVVGLLSVAADFLDIAGKTGFGWKQITGFEVGVLAVVLGASLRKDVIAVGGLVLVVVALGADYFSLGHAPGIGWRQVLALSLSLALIVLGLQWQRGVASR